MQRARFYASHILSTLAIARKHKQEKGDRGICPETDLLVDLFHCGTIVTARREAAGAAAWHPAGHPTAGHAAWHSTHAAAHTCTVRAGSIEFHHDLRGC